MYEQYSDENVSGYNGPMKCWRAQTRSGRYRKRAGEEKNVRKSTYPPPADGPCVLFLCKSGCSANAPAGQAGSGALQGIGHFTECKVLKGNAARLHSGEWIGHGQGIAGVPGFIGR